MHCAKARGRTLLGQRRMRAELRHTLSSLLPRHIDSVFIDGDSFQVWQKLLCTRWCNEVLKSVRAFRPSQIYAGNLYLENRLISSLKESLKQKKTLE